MFYDRKEEIWFKRFRNFFLKTKREIKNQLKVNLFLTHFNVNVSPSSRRVLSLKLFFSLSLVYPIPSKFGLICKVIKSFKYFSKRNPCKIEKIIILQAEDKN